MILKEEYAAKPGYIIQTPLMFNMYAESKLILSQSILIKGMQISNFVPTTSGIYVTYKESNSEHTINLLNMQELTETPSLDEKIFEMIDSEQLPKKISKLGERNFKTTVKNLHDLLNIPLRIYTDAIKKMEEKNNNYS